MRNSAILQELCAGNPDCRKLLKIPFHGKFEETLSMRQVEGVELFRRRSEVAKLVGGCSRSRKGERRKRRRQQGIQIVDRADADRDMWTVMLSPVRGKVVCNSIDGPLVNLRVLRCGFEGGSGPGTDRCHKSSDCLE